MLPWHKKTNDFEVVPEKLVSPISKKILLVIFGMVAGFQLYLYSLPKGADPSHLIDIISVLNPLAATIVGFVVAKRYRGSKIFGKAYFALAVGLLMNVVGETIYAIYDFQGNVPNFGINDILFYSFYPLVLAHLVLNIRFFKPKIGILTKAWVTGIPVILTIVYSILSYQQSGQANFDYYTGLIYVILAASILSGTMLGARVFRQGLLGKAWLLLVIGILLTTIGDMWYSYLNVYNQYTLLQPVNLFWYAGYMVITYALYKHQKVV